MNYATLSIMVILILCFGLCYLQYFKDNSARISQFNNVLIALFLLFNPYIFDLVTFNFQDTLEITSWMAYLLLLHYGKMQVLGYFSIGVSSLLNPSNGLYLLLGLIQKKQKEVLKFIAIIAGMWISFCYLYMFSEQTLYKYYSGLYFPQVYEPQFNLLWILYAHVKIHQFKMFERYLLLYQIVFIVLKINSLILVVCLPLNLQLKIIIIMYFRMYCNYKCSELSMIGTLLIYSIILAQHINKAISKWSELQNNYEIKKLKLLTLITVIANIALFPLEKILMNKYLNDFSINIGYLFWFIGLSLAFNAIYISELVINQTDLKEKKRQSQTAKIQKQSLQEQLNQSKQQIIQK